MVVIDNAAPLLHDLAPVEGSLQTLLLLCGPGVCRLLCGRFRSQTCALALKRRSSGLLVSLLLLASQLLFRLEATLSAFYFEATLRIALRSTKDAR